LDGDGREEGGGFIHHQHTCCVAETYNTYLDRWVTRTRKYARFLGQWFLMQCGAAWRSWHPWCTVWEIGGKEGRKQMERGIGGGDYIPATCACIVLFSNRCKDIHGYFCVFGTYICELAFGNAGGYGVLDLGFGRTRRHQGAVPYSRNIASDKWGFRKQMPCRYGK
jgi:hypothetical protein